MQRETGATPLTRYTWCVNEIGLRTSEGAWQSFNARRRAGAGLDQRSDAFHYRPLQRIRRMTSDLFLLQNKGLKTWQMRVITNR